MIGFIVIALVVSVNSTPLNDALPQQPAQNFTESPFGLRNLPMDRQGNELEFRGGKFARTNETYINISWT